MSRDSLTPAKRRILGLSVVDWIVVALMCAAAWACIVLSFSAF